MALLTTRQSNLLKCLLDYDVPMAISDIGLDLGLTPRQVSYNLKPVKRWLQTRQATLKSTPGVGVMIVYDRADYAALVQALNEEVGFQFILSPDQRRQLIILTLLYSNEPVILAQLQTAIDASRTTILNDLQIVDTWLASFNLSLIRRTNYGFSLEGTELVKRQALTALLWGETNLGQSLWQMTFNGHINFALPNSISNPPIIPQVHQYVASWDTEKTLPLVAQAEAAFDGRFTDNAVLHLALALAIQIQRVQAEQYVSINTKTQTWLKNQPVWPVAGGLMKSLFDDSQVRKNGPGEQAALAMHLLAGDRSESWPTEPALDNEFANLVDIFIAEASAALNAPSFIQDATLRDGLNAHLIPAYLRQRFELWAPAPLPEGDLPPNLEAMVDMTREIIYEISSQADVLLPESELNNLALLLRAALIRARPHRKEQVFVVCPSGMATAQLLVARLKARFSGLEILGVLSVRELTAREAAHVSLIISTVPLDARSIGTHVIQVHPLLLPEDIETINRWLT